MANSGVCEQWKASAHLLQTCGWRHGGSPPRLSWLPTSTTEDSANYGRVTPAKLCYLNSWDPTKSFYEQVFVSSKFEENKRGARQAQKLSDHYWCLDVMGISNIINGTCFRNVCMLSMCNNPAKCNRMADILLGCP